MISSKFCLPGVNDHKSFLASLLSNKLWVTTPKKDYTMGRLIIISNRLPFSLEKEGDKVSLRQSSGGLVSAIKSYFENSTAQRGDLTGKMWMGVADFPQEDWDQVLATPTDKPDFEVLPVFVEKDLYENFYNGFANSVLW